MGRDRVCGRTDENEQLGRIVENGIIGRRDGFEPGLGRLRDEGCKFVLDGSVMSVIFSDR